MFVIRIDYFGVHWGSSRVRVFGCHCWIKKSADLRFFVRIGVGEVGRTEKALDFFF